jgi:hypothetical protein
LSKSVFSGVFLMSSSKLLEQAIVDAQALRDSAYKSAQASLVEKFAPQIKEAVEKLLEQENPAEDPSQMGALTAPVDFGGAPEDPSDKSFVAGAAKDVPLAATDGEKLCPCPDDDDTVTLEIDLAKLADELMVGKEDDEEDINMQPTMAGMQDQPQAMGGATQLAEELELDSIELDENVEIDLDEALEETHDDSYDPEAELDDPRELQRQAELSPKQKKIAQAAPPKNKITGADFKALKNKQQTNEEEMEEGKGARNPLASAAAAQGVSQAELADQKAAAHAAMLAKKNQFLDQSPEAVERRKQRAAMKASVSESQTKELLKASTVLLKEVENKDAKINKLLEENQKMSSTLEEMSIAFKKLEQVNLLNATLFYQNQVLKSASLNERQKTHIVEAISKADSVNEAKAVYETLINSVGGTAEKERSPKSLNEAISKKSSFRLPHKQAEQSYDPNKDRWLKLAGIK